MDNVDEAIAKAQAGRVNVSPLKAVEMAGQLYSRRQYGQAQRVCRQIIQARPANPDAHNILGVTLAAMGNTDEAIASLRRAIKLNPQAPDPVQQQVFSIMPWMMMFVMANFAAGLQLYWATSNLLTIAQQRWLYHRYPALKQKK